MKEELKTLNVLERLINYKVFSYICQVNMLPTRKENVLSVKQNTNQLTEEVKLVLMNVRKKESIVMINNILNNIQKFQEKLLRIGKKITRQELMKEQEKDGEKIKDYKLEIIPMNLLEKEEFQDMESVNYVEDYQREKPTILNIQRRILY